MPPARAAIVLPAAGASSRMRGADKLLERIGGVSILHRQCARACALGLPVAVTLRPGDTARRAALAGLPCTVLAVPDAAEGMAASLRAAAAWAAEQRAAALMVLLPDMPAITTDDLRALLEAQDIAPDRPLRAATADGHPGHPALLPAATFPALATLTGDTGARALLDEARLVPLEGDRARTDLDTPEDWAAWRARQTP